MTRSERITVSLAFALAMTSAIGCAGATEPGSDTEATGSVKPVGLTRTEIVSSLHALALDTSKHGVSRRRRQSARWQPQTTRRPSRSTAGRSPAVRRAAGGRRNP
jgi:hypothetical protein